MAEEVLAAAPEETLPDAVGGGPEKAKPATKGKDKKSKAKKKSKKKKLKARKKKLKARKKSKR
jgi:hypothetical protein